MQKEDKKVEKELKPFDLEAALAGAKVQTRAGSPVLRVVHVPEVVPYPVLVVWPSGGTSWRSAKGCLYASTESQADLVMAPVKRTVWVNVYRTGSAVGVTMGGTYASKEEGVQAARVARNDHAVPHLGTFPLEIEE